MKVVLNRSEVEEAIVCYLDKMGIAATNGAEVTLGSSTATVRIVKDGESIDEDKATTCDVEEQDVAVASDTSETTVEPQETVEEEQPQPVMSFGS